MPWICVQTSALRIMPAMCAMPPTSCSHLTFVQMSIYFGIKFTSRDWSTNDPFPKRFIRKIFLKTKVRHENLIEVVGKSPGSMMNKPLTTWQRLLVRFSLNLSKVHLAFNFLSRSLEWSAQGERSRSIKSLTTCLASSTSHFHCISCFWLVFPCFQNTTRFFLVTPLTCHPPPPKGCGARRLHGGSTFPLSSPTEGMKNLLCSWSCCFAMFLGSTETGSTHLKFAGCKRECLVAFG